MNNQPSQPAPTEACSPKVGEARRRFVRGVGIATPVILTMASRSALAAAGGCLSPSAQASIALEHSRPNRDGFNCAGTSPGYWKQASYSGTPHYNDWLASGAEGVHFSSIFTGGFPGKTLKDVLRNGNGQVNGFSDPDELGAHLSAAWCNLKTNKVPFGVVSLAQLQQMWAGRTSGYSPVPGVVWYGADIVAYIKTTFGG